MITILPVGWLLYTGGSLPIETFITTIVLPLALPGPAGRHGLCGQSRQGGHHCGSVDAILNGAEQDHGETPAEFQGRGIQLSHVSFGYHADKEVLHDVSLTIPAGTMTAFVGPSGSGKSTLMRTVNQLVVPSGGHVYIDGEEVTGASGKKLRLLRRKSDDLSAL